MATDSKYWIDWYHSLSKEEKKKHNQERYQKYKERYNAQSRQWAKDNPEWSRCSSHTSSIKRKYFKSITENSPNTKELFTWVQQQKDSYCPYCGQKSNSIDHIFPLSKGGKHELDNLEYICNCCNIAKQDKTKEEFLAWIRQLMNFQSSKIV